MSTIKELTQARAAIDHAKKSSDVVITSILGYTEDDLSDLRALHYLLKYAHEQGVPVMFAPQPDFIPKELLK